MKKNLKHNRKILIVFSVLRQILTVRIINYSKLSILKKTILIYFPFLMDDFDSNIPYFFVFYKTEKKYKLFSIGANQELGKYYTVIDKINDSITDSLLLYNIWKNNMFDKNSQTILLLVHLNRIIGNLLYFSYINKLVYISKMKIYNKGRSLMFFYPNYFPLFLFNMIICNKFSIKKEFFYVIMIKGAILKNIQEYYLHVNNNEI